MCNGPLAAGDYRGRCGPGPRLPFLVISPYARQNYIDHAQLEQTSIIRFIEDNWGLPPIGDQSFDTRPPAYGGLKALFDFAAPTAPKLWIDPVTGREVGSPPPPVFAPTPTAVPTVAPTAVPTATATP